jgi:DNA topoisomerase IB
LLDRIAVPEPPTDRALRAVVNDVVRTIAAEMRNTPAVCRKSYICPSVFEAWRNGRLAAIARRYAPSHRGTKSGSNR